MQGEPLVRVWSLSPVVMSRPPSEAGKDLNMTRRISGNQSKDDFEQLQSRSTGRPLALYGPVDKKILQSSEILWMFLSRPQRAAERFEAKDELSASGGKTYSLEPADERGLCSFPCDVTCCKSTAGVDDVQSSKMSEAGFYPTLTSVQD
ncbi:hypothetical protein INR49_016155 [Caranx melampygus]|nr:hypothetical protein INR49_016155 [Caranx melampygus]